jgi:AraC-like DNA-binding protein/quercetin dioxygenase-like cupin family protein
VSAGLPPTNSQSVTITRRVAPARSVQRLAHRDRIDWHDHGEHQLIYPKSGVLIASNMTGTWVLPPRRALWLPAGVPHTHQAHGVTDMRSVSFPPRPVSFSPRGVSLPPRGVSFPPRGVSFPPRGRRFERTTVLSVSPLAREAILALTELDLPDRERRPIRRVLLDQLTPLPDGPFYLPEPADDRVGQIASMLHQDPADRRTLAEFGMVVGASERTLSRLFRAQTGLTFPQWRAQVRLHHAMRRLASGTPVTVVAHETGYANASAFVEAFRLATGTTPGAYQRTLV